MKAPILSLALTLAIHTPSTAAEKTSSTVQANTEFGLDLYARLAEENPDKNLFFSPYSISNALAMTAEGARGQTALEMGSVLGLSEAARNGDSENRPWNMDELHTSMGVLNEQFNHSEKPYALSIANAIWGEKSYSFSDTYIDKLNSTYGTDSLRLVDFANDFEAERKRINQWVEEQTEERIKDLLQEGTLSKLTRMVLVNAIYFKGDWATQFDTKLTREGDFSTGSRKSIKAQLMNARSMSGGRYAAFDGSGSFFDTPAFVDGSGRPTYPDADGFAIAELPYQGNELSMVVIAPNSADGLASIERKLNSKNLAGWLDKLQKREMHVTMPKFKSETNYTLNGALKEMGMPSAFSPPLANFNGMRQGESNAHLSISLVAHKAFIEVNEKGTEAAAATAVPMAEDPSSPLLQFIPHLRANKPFIYFIRDTKTGTILFLGRMNKPAI